MRCDISVAFYLNQIMVHLSVFLKAKIIVLWEQNKGIKAIARELGVARNTVRRWIRRYEETGDVNCERRGPRPIAYTNENSRHREIVSLHSEDPFKTTRSTASLYDISLYTVRRHLHAAGIHNYKPAKKIPLTEEHRQARIRFATEYLNFDWEGQIVIFTDEKCFKSDDDGRKILWRRRGERYNPENMVPLRTSGRISLGYWGWMSMVPGELVEVGGRMNSEKYIEILRDVLVPSVRVMYPEGQIYLVQDNCSIHRSRRVTEWLTSQADITVIDWPSKSPDLNPIENLWGQMVLNWDTSEVRDAENLDLEVKRSWELMRCSNICSVMTSGMKSRLEQILQYQGYNLKY